jgi:hypothetical protein
VENIRFLETIPKGIVNFTIHVLLSLLHMVSLNDSKNAYTYAAVLDIRLPGRSKDYYIFQLAHKVGKFRTIVIDRGYTTLSLVEKLFKK